MGQASDQSTVPEHPVFSYLHKDYIHPLHHGWIAIGGLYVPYRCYLSMSLLINRRCTRPVSGISLNIVRKSNPEANFRHYRRYCCAINGESIMS